MITFLKSLGACYCDTNNLKTSFFTSSDHTDILGL